MNPDIPQLKTVLRRTVHLLLLVVFLSITIQSQQQQREIISHDFTKNRQNAAPVQHAKGSQKQSRNRLQSASRPNRTYAITASTVTNGPILVNHSVKQLGITIWRLRPRTDTDQGPAITVTRNGSSAELVPERVNAGTEFRQGDLVRLSIESAHAGYLYVINRDLFADGTTSTAEVIYPWAGMFWGDNRVRPGRVIDIPSQEDSPSYFTATPTKPNQKGELLTFIVTKSPLKLRFVEEKAQISDEQMAKWEKTWSAQSERFEMNGGAGETWTEQEQQAATGLRPRRLTRNDPAPQTIFRVASSDRLAFLVKLKLSYE